MFAPIWYFMYLYTLYIQNIAYIRTWKAENSTIYNRWAQIHMNKLQPPVYLLVQHVIARHDTAAYKIEYSKLKVISRLFSSLSFYLSFTYAYASYKIYTKYTHTFKHNTSTRKLSIYLPTFSLALALALSTPPTLSLALSSLYLENIFIGTLYNIILNEKVTARGYVVKMCIFIIWARNFQDQYHQP